MTNLDTFSKRLSYGILEEDEQLEVIKNKGYQASSTRNFREHNPEFDLKNGDIFIYHEGRIIKVDCKKGGISKKSIENFQGDYYIVNTYSGRYVYSTRTLKSYASKIKDWSKHKLSSGDPGLKLGTIKNIKKRIRLEDWLNNKLEFI